MADSLSDLGFVPQADDLSDLGFAPTAVPAATTPEVQPPEPTIEEIEALKKRREELRAAELAAEPGLEPGLIERYGPSIAAGLEAYGRTMLPFIYTGYERLAGVPEADIERRREEHPVAAGLGTVGGLIGGLAVTGGIGPAAEAAGIGAAEAAAAAGAGRLGQAAAAARAAATTPAALKEAAAAPVALAARLGAATKAGATALAPEVAALAPGAGRLAQASYVAKETAAKVAPSVAAAAAEGAALATAFEADESLLPNHQFSGQAILNGALISGGLSGVLSGVITAPGVFGKTPTGQRVAERMGKKAAENLLQKYGTTAREEARAIRWVGEEKFVNRLNEAERMKIAGPGISVEKSAERAQDVLDEAGGLIGKFAEEADARIVASPNLAPSVDDVIEKMSDDVLAPISERPEFAEVAGRIAQRLADYRRAFRGQVTLGKLQQFRTDISKTIDGIYAAPGSTEADKKLASALRGLRNVLTDQIGESLQRTGLDPKAWKVPQRQYEVASQIKDLTDDARLRRLAQKPQGVLDTIKPSVFPAISAAAGYLYKGGTGAAIAAAGAKGLGMVYEGLAEFTPSMVQRALESGAPKSIVKDMERFARERSAKIAEGAPRSLPTPAATKMDAAERQYLDVYQSLRDANMALKNSPDFAEESFDVYRKAVSDSLDDMEFWYSFKNKTPEDLGVALEKLELSLTPLASFGPGRSAFHKPAVDIMRDTRNKAAATLALSDLWGTQRHLSAINRTNRAAAALVDPDRMEALNDLQKKVLALQKKSTEKTGTLMNVGKGAGKAAIRTLETEPGRQAIKKGYRAVIEMSGFAGKPAETKFTEIEIEPEAEAE